MKVLLDLSILMRGKVELAEVGKSPRMVMEKPIGETLMKKPELTLIFMLKVLIKNHHQELLQKQRLKKEEMLRQLLKVVPKQMLKAA